jgi:hypothetical protein
VARPTKKPDELCNNSVKVYVDEKTGKILTEFTTIQGYSSLSNAARHIIVLFFKKEQYDQDNSTKTMKILRS